MSRSASASAGLALPPHDRGPVQFVALNARMVVNLRDAVQVAAAAVLLTRASFELPRTSPAGPERLRESLLPQVCLEIRYGTGM